MHKSVARVQLAVYLQRRETEEVHAGKMRLSDFNRVDKLSTNVTLRLTTAPLLPTSSGCLYAYSRILLRYHALCF